MLARNSDWYCFGCRLCKDGRSGPAEEALHSYDTNKLAACCACGMWTSAHGIVAIERACEMAACALN